MGIGILYESEEWSTYALWDRIEAMGIPAKLICMEKEVSFSDLEDCELILNRVFASSQFRGHQKSLEQTPRILKRIKRLRQKCWNSMVYLFRKFMESLEKEVKRNEKCPIHAS